MEEYVGVRLDGFYSILSVYVLTCSVLSLLQLFHCYFFFIMFVGVILYFTLPCLAVLILYLTQISSAF